jgi:hypothetical protein
MARAASYAIGDRWPQGGDAPSVAPSHRPLYCAESVTVGINLGESAGSVAMNDKSVEFGDLGPGRGAPFAVPLSLGILAVRRCCC